MAYVALAKHDRPRVMMIDFAQVDVDLVRNAGFEAFRAASGLYDSGKFHIPLATQDVEVLFANVNSGTFTNVFELPSTDSVETEPLFGDLVRETWFKGGWAIFFISQGISPAELNAIGITEFGIFTQRGRQHWPASLRKSHLEAVTKPWHEPWEPETLVAEPTIPSFRGAGLHFSELEESRILNRYRGSSQFSVLSCLATPQGTYIREELRTVRILGEDCEILPLIHDDSVNKNILAYKCLRESYGTGDDNSFEIRSGGVMFLPDFGKNNSKVALALLQEIFSDVSPHLFDSPQHPWLEKYQPAPVTQLDLERKRLMEDAKLKLQDFNKKINEKLQEYRWLMGLLTSTGDQFAADAATALRFLGFEVEEVDNTLAAGERRREDYRIWDRATGYFALGEAKTTGKTRGASEDFITKIHTHQTRYAHEIKQAPPPAILIVNYAIDLDPVHRSGQFYKTEVAGRLMDIHITALSSVALFEICQLVLKEEIHKDIARRFLSDGKPLIPSVTLGEFATESNSSSPR